MNEFKNGLKSNEEAVLQTIVAMLKYWKRPRCFTCPFNRPLIPNEIGEYIKNVVTNGNLSS